MSKKRRLRKRIKQNQKEVKIAGGFDAHHLLFQKNSWRGGYKGALRMHWYCKVYIPKNTLHRKIHSSVTCVPVPHAQAIKDALRQLDYLSQYHAISENDPIDKRLKVLIALFECASEPTANALKRQLEVVNRFYSKPS